MNRIKYSIKRVLFSETTLGAVVLIAIVVFAATAQADWVVEEDENHGTVATLTGLIQAGDEEIPEADLYFINSGGGYVEVGYKISEQLKNSSKPIYYGTAGSIAALIALETGAKPISKKAMLGFHWTVNDDGTAADPALAEYINTRNAQAMINKIPMSIVAKIMGQMARIEGKKQSTSIVYWIPATNKIITIIEGKIE